MQDFCWAMTCCMVHKVLSLKDPHYLRKRNYHREEIAVRSARHHVRPLPKYIPFLKTWLKVKRSIYRTPNGRFLLGDDVLHGTQSFVPEGPALPEEEKLPQGRNSFAKRPSSCGTFPKIFSLSKNLAQSESVNLHDSQWIISDGRRHSLPTRRSSDLRTRTT